MPPMAWDRAKDKSKIYRPTEKEPFMNERQNIFPPEARDLAGRHPERGQDTLQHLQDENVNHPDLADRASSETDRAISFAPATASAS